MTVSQQVIEHGSATVGFEQYRPLLETALKLLPHGCTVTLLADRGFEHGALMRWLRHQGWSWAIRAKSELNITLSQGRTRKVAQLLPPVKQAFCFHHVTVLGDIDCHLATANPDRADDPWAVLTDRPPSLQTFALYGQRFGGIEPHFKDYKSAGFTVESSQLRHARALTCLFMLLDSAYLIAFILGVMLVQLGERLRVDWHGHRGLSFWQLGLRQLKGLCYNRLPLPTLLPFPLFYPPPACASRRKREQLEYSIQFARVTSFRY